MADAGTLFLDEIGELPLGLQAKLLRVLEMGEVFRVGSHEAKRVNAYVIAATNRDLRIEVAAGRFRSDLYYRLNNVEIRLPALRDRREDIPYLTASFVKDTSDRLQKSLARADPGRRTAAQPGALGGQRPRAPARCRARVHPGRYRVRHRAGARHQHAAAGHDARALGDRRRRRRPRVRRTPICWSTWNASTSSERSSAPEATRKRPRRCSVSAAAPSTGVSNGSTWPPPFRVAATPRWWKRRPDLSLRSLT